MGHPAVSQYLGYLGCYYNSFDAQITEGEDGQSITFFGFVNGAMIAGGTGRLGWPLGLAALGVGAAVDIPTGIQANRDCTTLIYGH